MIKFIFIVLFSISITHSQSDIKALTVNVGDVLTLGKSTSRGYQHIYFPKNNFIIKKGGIVNFKKLKEDKVKIINKEKIQDNKTIITLKRTDGKKFFNCIPVVKAHLEKAVNNKEILLN